MSTQPSAPIRVLVVDDHRLLVEAISLAFEREEGMEVVADASTRDEALRAVEDHRPDVVLMDYFLAEGDGAEATRAIKALDPRAKVVMLTGAEDEGVLTAAVESGCSGFISKRRPLDEIAEAVRRAHAGEAVISSPALTGVLSRLRADGTGHVGDLTPREREVLRFLAEGRSNQDMADMLVISLKTVRNHVQNILVKLGAHSRLEAVAIGRRKGILSR